MVHDDKEGKSIAVKIEDGEESIIVYNIHAPVIEKRESVIF